MLVCGTFPLHEQRLIVVQLQYSSDGELSAGFLVTLNPLEM